MTEDLDKAAKLTRAITERQIAAAVAMWRDPENWALTPIDGMTRTFYRRIKSRGA